MFQKSSAITDFFNKNQHLDGFWDFVHESNVYDAQWWDGDDDSLETLERGFNLAIKAANHPVFQFSSADANLYLYFIGPEKDIVTKLNSELENWLQKYPQETEKQKKASALRKRREEAEKKLKSAEMDLEIIKQMEQESKISRKSSK